MKCSPEARRRNEGHVADGGDKKSSVSAKRESFRVCGRRKKCAEAQTWDYP